MDKNEWNVGEAKQQFSEVLRRSETEPQFIYRRDRLIAKVVAMDETKEAAVVTSPTIGQRFEELREILRSEKYQMPRIPKRRNRRNDFARTLNEVAGRHKRSK